MERNFPSSKDVRACSGTVYVYPHTHIVPSCFARANQYRSRDEFRARVKKSGRDGSILPVALVQRSLSPSLPFSVLLAGSFSHSVCGGAKIGFARPVREPHLNSFTESLATVIMPRTHLRPGFLSAFFSRPRGFSLFFNKTSYCAKRMADRARSAQFFSPRALFNFIQAPASSFDFEIITFPFASLTLLFFFPLFPNNT